MKNMFCTIFLLLIPLSNAVAAIREKDRNFAPRVEQSFPIDPQVKKLVAFWQIIFQKYPSTTVLIHDTEDPTLLIDLVDMNVIAPSVKKVRGMSRDEFNKLTKAYMRRYQFAVSQIQKDPDAQFEVNSIEERMLKVYRRDPLTAKRLKAGDVTVRAQQGLADTFQNAANEAQKYLPFMEATFAKAGLPVILTRLPFVESMFNLSARSKVGASGIWQFMPETAKIYMNVSPLFDERNSPFKATRAAAKLMLDNYRELGSWPLAITAYNHGQSGLSKATKILGTRNLGTIIEKYSSPSFGFASRNFYAEFIAAVSSYSQLQKQGRIYKNPNFAYDELTLTKNTSLKRLAGERQVSVETILLHNPCINSNWVQNNADVTLPSGFQIFLPQRLSRNVKISSELKSKKPQKLTTR